MRKASGGEPSGRHFVSLGGPMKIHIAFPRRLLMLFPIISHVWPFVPELPRLPLIRTMRGALQGALGKRQQAGLLARRP